jgi:dTDP-4-dehydrorhamnose reductase
VNRIVSAVRGFNPKIVINCAAHTNVEAAEVDVSVDYRANALIPQALAKACLSWNATLVHFSSTGCYGDWKDTPFVETDECRPLTQHHRSKAAGESLILDSGCRSLIIRTGWLYGGAAGQPKNFVWKRLVEAASAAEVMSDTTQRGCPTYVADVVRQILCMLEYGLEGTFNVVAHGVASRFDYVSAIVKFSGLPCGVLPGPAFQRLAPVSPNEAANNERLQFFGLDMMTDWRTSLRTYVRELQAADAG